MTEYSLGADHTTTVSRIWKSITFAGTPSMHDAMQSLSSFFFPAMQMCSFQYNSEVFPLHEMLVSICEVAKSLQEGNDFSKVLFPDGKWAVG